MPTAVGFSDRVNAIDRNAHSVVSPGFANLGDLIRPRPPVDFRFEPARLLGRNYIIGGEAKWRTALHEDWLHIGTYISSFRQTRLVHFNS
jgi:hypothetical protein